jgi:signal transduction histidine kinase
VRRRILGVAVLAVAIAVTVFAVPLAIVVSKLVYGNERTELERQALKGAVDVSLGQPGSGVSSRAARAAATRVGVYDAAGRRLAGKGPVRGDAAVLGALAGTVSDRSTGAELVVAVPVFSGEEVTAVSRAASPRSDVERRIHEAWAAMLGLGLLAAACASLLAATQARRLTTPLERLESVAKDLGAGNFASRAPNSGVGEIDRAGHALNRTAERLGDLLARERAFSANASHQLRTPLTGLRLGLETAMGSPEADLRSAISDAIRTVDQLSGTVDDVLALARGTSTRSRLDLTTVLDQVRARWDGTLSAAGRRLQVEERDPPAVDASAPAVRQVMDVLLDNAFRHGVGTVTVLARSSGDALAIDVLDEGLTPERPLLPVPEDVSGVPRHLGLALARAIAEAEGGRLVHARTEPRTRLTLLLPAAAPPSV